MIRDFSDRVPRDGELRLSFFTREVERTPSTFWTFLIDDCSTYIIRLTAEQMG